MVAILISAVVTCVGSLFLGQAALRLSGAQEWNWLAPPVGISVAMLVATPAIDVPGGCTAVAILMGVLTVASIAWCGTDPAHRPPISGLLAALPVAALVLVPFLAAGHGGILGASFNNDMAAHMSIAEGFLSGDIAGIAPPDYPIGPHAIVALIAEGLGARVDRAFAGWSMALPILSAWTALALARRGSWLGQMITATVVGMPFLVAAYYGQGAFKEVLQAGLVLATALYFSGYGPSLGRGRWVPLALLLGGILSVYSVAGLVWPLAFGALWLIIVAARRVRRHGTEGITDLIVRQLPSIGIGLAVLTVSVAPELPRIVRFLTLDQASNIAKDDIGNLAGPLPVWEAFGVWNTPDFRLPASPPFTGGMWTAFVLALVLIGAVWAIRRGRWMLPLAAAASLFIWAVSNHSQSPYVAAKALVILSPLLLAVAVLPFVEQKFRRPRSWSSLIRVPSGQPFSLALAAILIVTLFLRIGNSDGQALRASSVGPTDHLEELRELRSMLDGEPTLFLGNDDFIRWELSGVPVHAPVVGLEELPIRPQKDWSYGEAHDFDSVAAATLNSYEWIITTRDPAGSAPPAGVSLVRATPDFLLWRRERTVAPRSILAEGESAGAVLDCRTPNGRAVLMGGGIAAVRPQPLTAPGLSLAPGATGSVQLRLHPGRWQLGTSYLSRVPIDVDFQGMRATLPANLDRPGPRWPIGRVTVRGRQPIVITFTARDPLLAPAMPVAELSMVVATRDTPIRIVPVRQACGRYVDWYRRGGG